MSSKPTPNHDAIIAIHKYCLGCMGQSRNEVHKCSTVKCPLWPWREPEREAKEQQEKGQITIFDFMKAGIKI